MRSSCWFMALVGTFSATAWLGGQAPQRQAVAATGLIAGQVLDASSGRPVPDATVVLRQGRGAGARGRGSVVSPPPAPVMTDAQGRYFFARLVPGTYAVFANKPGYLTPRSGGTNSVDLGNNERAIDVRILLDRVASLSGVLRDEAGDPVVGTDVIALTRSLLNGQPSLQAQNRAKSDDRGAFRIPNLPPGEYIVCACTRDPIPFDGMLLTTLASEPVQLMTLAARALTVGSDVVTLDNTLRTYAPTLYQDSQTVAGSTPVVLAAGEDRTTVDFNIPLVRATRVSGTIAGAPGPIPSSLVRLVPARDADTGMELVSYPALLVQPDGRFDFSGIPPDQYKLRVTYLGTSPPGAGPTGAALGFIGGRGVAPMQAPARVSGGPATGQDALWADVSVTVGDDGIAGLVVTLNPARKVTGRIEFVGTAPRPPARGFAFALGSIGVVRPNGPLVARVATDNTFVANGALPGKYSLNLNGLPGYQNVQSVTAGGVDITDLPLVVRDRDITDVVLTLVDTPMATLTVQSSDVGATAGELEQPWALVFPSDNKYWADPSAAWRRFRPTTLNASGSGTLPNLPAGEYFLAIVTGADALNWQEASKLEALSRRAQRVTLGNGEAKTVEVRR